MSYDAIQDGGFYLILSVQNKILIMFVSECKFKYKRAIGKKLDHTLFCNRAWHALDFFADR